MAKAKTVKNNYITDCEQCPEHVRAECETYKQHLIEQAAADELGGCFHFDRYVTVRLRRTMTKKKRIKWGLDWAENLSLKEAHNIKQWRERKRKNPLFKV